MVNLRTRSMISSINVENCLPSQMAKQYNMARLFQNVLFLSGHKIFSTLRQGLKCLQWWGIKACSNIPCDMSLSVSNNIGMRARLLHTTCRNSNREASENKVQMAEDVRCGEYLSNGTFELRRLRSQTKIKGYMFHFIHQINSKRILFSCREQRTRFDNHLL